MSKKKLQKSKFNLPFFLMLLISVLTLGFLIIYMSITRPFCANSISCMNGLTGKFDPNAKEAQFLGQNIQPPKFITAFKKTTGDEPVDELNADMSSSFRRIPRQNGGEDVIADKPTNTKVLGEVSVTNKRIEVDLSTQMLYAIEDEKVAFSFPISSGKWNKTPTGIFHIWIKLKYTRMSGGQGADYYNLPNVPYVMFYYNDKVSKTQGFSLHGAYWHNNFGYPMSHGCVNISPANAGKLYEWAGPIAEGNITYASDTNPGTEVIIY